MNTFELKFKEAYGISYKDKATIQELNRFSKFPEILDEIGRQRAFTRRQLAELFNRDGQDQTIRTMLDILVYRTIIKEHVFTGSASFNGGFYYTTDDATQEDIDNKLIKWKNIDQLLKTKREQRTKKPKTTQEKHDEWDELRQMKKDTKLEEKINTHGFKASQVLFEKAIEDMGLIDLANALNEHDECEGCRIRGECWEKKMLLNKLALHDRSLLKLVKRNNTEVEQIKPEDPINKLLPHIKQREIQADPVSLLTDDTEVPLAKRIPIGNPMGKESDGYE
ncbi:MAG: hypothetical protein V3V41_07935 [Candidatus Heimdallarchaeota archaeon]